jgi:hypothetical protein
MVAEYKKVCGKDPRRQKCSSNDPVSILVTKKDALTRCVQKRIDYQNECIHKDARDIGHLWFLNNLKDNAVTCNALLSPPSSPDGMEWVDDGMEWVDDGMEWVDDGMEW